MAKYYDGISNRHNTESTSVILAIMESYVILCEHKLTVNMVEFIVENNSRLLGSRIMNTGNFL